MRTVVNVGILIRLIFSGWDGVCIVVGEVVTTLINGVTVAVVEGSLTELVIAVSKLRVND